MSLDKIDLRLNLLAAASLPLAGWLGERLAPSAAGAVSLLAGLPLALAVIWLWYRPLARPAGRLPPVLPGVIAGALLARIDGLHATGDLPEALASLVAPGEGLLMAWLLIPAEALTTVLAALLIAVAGRALSRHGLLFSPRRWTVLGLVAGGTLVILHAAAAMFRIDGSLLPLLMTVMVRAAGDLLAVLTLLPAALIWWLEPQPCPVRNGRSRIVLVSLLALVGAAVVPLWIGAAGWLALPFVAALVAVRGGARALGIGGSLVLLMAVSSTALGAGPFGELSPLVQRLALLTLWWTILPPGLWLAGLAAPEAPRPQRPQRSLKEGAAHAPD